MFNCGSSGSGFKASMTKLNGFQNSFLWHSSYAYLATFWGLHRSWEKIFTRAITFGTVSAWLNSSLHYHELTNILNSVDVNNATIKRPCIFFFVFFSGGCFVEGEWMRNAFRWRETIGPWEERPGHFGDVWMYWTDDGLGYLEFLQVCACKNLIFSLVL